MVPNRYRLQSNNFFLKFRELTACGLQIPNVKRTLEDAVCSGSREEKASSFAVNANRVEAGSSSIPANYNDGSSPY